MQLPGRIRHARDPLPLDRPRTLRLAFRFEPSAGESGLPQSAPDVWAPPHEIPKQTGPVVLNHHDDRTLIPNRNLVG